MVMAIRRFLLLVPVVALIGAGAIVCLCKEPLPLTETVTAVPVGML